MVIPSRLVPSAKGLFVFEAAARTSSFTAAAREFNLTQPSVSRSIAQLEEGLGTKLFEREPSGLRLTVDGRDLHAAVSDGIGRIVDTIGLIRERHRAAKPLVTLSLSSSFVTHWLVPRLDAFNSAFPEVDLRFDLISGLMPEGIPENVDLATRIVADDDTRYHRWDLAPEIIVPVCSPSYLDAHGRLDHDGSGRGHVFLHLTGHAVRDWGRVGANPSREGSVSHEFSDYSVILQAAVNGQGIALGWLSVVSGALLEGLLVPASARQFETGRCHRLIARRSKPLRPVVAEIGAWLASAMAEDLQRVRPVLRADA